MYRASTLARLAHEAMNAGERNAAIGSVQPLEHEFEEIDALLTTVLILHRTQL